MQTQVLYSKRLRFYAYQPRTQVYIRIMLNDLAYDIIINLLDALMWDGELVGEENIQKGPGVLVANHMGPIGPVGICCSMPMRLYPWVLGETVDKVKAPERIQVEFVESALKFKPPLSGMIARVLCKISIPLLLSLGCIPVPSTHLEQEATFERSLKLLEQGKFLLIVPEDPEAEPDPRDGISRFKRGFLRLGELYAKATAKRLPFYPVVVHEAGLVMVEKPVFYNPMNNSKVERSRMVGILESTVRDMYRRVGDMEFLPSVTLKHRHS